MPVQPDTNVVGHLAGKHAAGIALRVQSDITNEILAAEFRRLADALSRRPAAVGKRWQIAVELARTNSLEAADTWHTQFAAASLVIAAHGLGALDAPQLGPLIANLPQRPAAVELVSFYAWVAHIYSRLQYCGQLPPLQAKFPCGEPPVPAGDRPPRRRESTPPRTMHDEFRDQRQTLLAFAELISMPLIQEPKQGV